MRETQMRLDPWVRKIPWRRKWQPTPVLLPEESPGQRSLMDYKIHGVAKSWTQLSDQACFLLIILFCNKWKTKPMRRNEFVSSLGQTQQTQGEGVYEEIWEQPGSTDILLRLLLDFWSFWMFCLFKWEQVFKATPRGKYYKQILLFLVSY